MAATTKIMTAIIALEKGDLASKVEVSKKPHLRGSSLHLKYGEKLTLKICYTDFYYVQDAAVAIAEHIAGARRTLSK